VRDIDAPLAWLTRRLRTVRGVWRISEKLRRRFVQRYAKDGHPWTVMNDFKGSLRLRIDRSSFMGSCIYWNGAFSPNELALLERLLEPEMVFVDVGANQGELTIFAASRVTRGQVLAFEPVESLHRQLLDNIALNQLSNVKAHHLALSDQPGRMTLFVDRRVTDGLNEGTASFFSGGERTSPAEVAEVAVFDDVFEASGLRRLDIMKVDVEGAELFVLRGAVRSLARHRPRLILELAEGNFAAAGYTTHDLLRFLLIHRYEFAVIGGGGRLAAISTATQLPRFCNVLCTPA